MAYEKPYEYKPGNGSAFKNDKKTEDWHGDLTGKIMLPDGKLHYLNIYNAAKKSGEAYFKVSIGKEVVATGSPAAPAYSAAHQPFAAPPASKAPGFDELDDDIPF